MEFANVKYISVDGKSFLKESCSLVLKYADLKALSPIVVDDLLRLHPTKENIALFSSYIEKNLLLVPIRRKPLVEQIDKINFPRRVLLEITSQCNLKCTMCPRNVLKRPQIHMPKKVALKCIDEIDKYGIEGLWLFNIGEAFLHPDFKEIFTYCQNKNNLGSQWLSTNGQDFTEENMDLLIQSNLTFFNFSINAMNSETYHLIIPDGSYKKLISNFEKFWEKKKKYNRQGTTPWLRVQMIEQPQVISEVDRFFVDFSKKAEILSINMLEAFSQNVSQNINFAKTRQRKLKKHCNRINRGDGFIFSDGEMSFCDTDFNHEMSIGNIYDSSIGTIWNGEDRSHIKELNQSGRLDEIEMCRNCLDYDL